MDLMSEFPLLSICIPTRNRPKELGETLRVLLNQLPPAGGASVEVIVSDNTDDEALLVPQETVRAPALRYIRNQGNLGYARNINNLIRAATGRYVWLVSDDDFVQESAVAEIVARLQSDQRINYLTFYTGAAFAGKVYDRNFYFKDLRQDFFQKGDDFLSKYWQSVIFVSCNIFHRERLLRHAEAHGLFENINAVYQNSLLGISFISKYGGVGIIQKLLLVDNYGNKVYSRATALDTPVLQYIKLWTQLSAILCPAAVAPLLRDVESSTLRHGLRFAIHRAEGFAGADYREEFLRISENATLPFGLRARARYVAFLLGTNRTLAGAIIKLISFLRIIRIDYPGFKAEAAAFEGIENSKKMRSVY